MRPATHGVPDVIILFTSPKSELHQSKESPQNRPPPFHDVPYGQYSTNFRSPIFWNGLRHDLRQNVHGGLQLGKDQYLPKHSIFSSFFRKFRSVGHGHESDDFRG